MMKQLLLAICLLALIGTPALAGKNAGGAMVVHTDDDITCTFFGQPDYCAIFPYDGEDCLELDPTSGVSDPNFLIGAIIYYVAAFPPGSSPGVTVLFFGHDHNFPMGFIGGWSFCGPENSLEVPDAGWPNDPNAGNSLAFGSPVVGDLVFPFYWLCVYAEAGNYIGPTINPTGGYAAFVSDDNPGVLDECFYFGQMRWAPESGFNACPSSEPMEACCFEDCSCLVLPEEECYSMGGDWGHGDSCVPNPCSCPPWACCFSDCSCMAMAEVECYAQGGDLWIEGEVCEPNPCPCPQVACCFPDGSCIQTIDIECEALGGEVHGEVCDPNPCPQPEACCFPDGTCTFVLVDACLAEDGMPQGEGTDCDPNPCDVIPTEETTWGTIKSDYR